MHVYRKFCQVFLRGHSQENQKNWEYLKLEGLTIERQCPRKIDKINFYTDEMILITKIWEISDMSMPRVAYGNGNAIFFAQQLKNTFFQNKCATKISSKKIPSFSNIFQSVKLGFCYFQQELSKSPKTSILVVFGQRKKKWGPSKSKKRTALEHGLMIAFE